MTVNLEGLVGLITPELGDELRRLAALVDPRLVIVELGSFKGMSTCYLAAGALEGGGAFVVAVDPWELEGNVDGKHGFARSATREAFEAQLERVGLRQRVRAIQGFSHQVARLWVGKYEMPADGCVGLLYIDGDHSFESVWRDFASWKIRLAQNAIVAFDDYDTPRNPGVKKAVHRLVDMGELDRFQVVAGRLAVCRYPHARPEPAVR